MGEGELTSNLLDLAGQRLKVNSSTSSPSPRGEGARGWGYSGATFVSAGRFLLIEINKATNTMRGAEGSTAVLA